VVQAHTHTDTHTDQLKGQWGIWQRDVLTPA